MYVRLTREYHMEALCAVLWGMGGLQAVSSAVQCSAMRDVMMSQGVVFALACFVCLSVSLPPSTVAFLRQPYLIMPRQAR